MSPNVGSVHQNQATGGRKGSVSVNPQRHRRIFRNLRVPGPHSSSADWDSPRVSSGSPSSQWLPLFPMGEWLGSPTRDPLLDGADRHLRGGASCSEGPWDGLRM